MLVDDVTIIVKAGNGGDGKVSFGPGQKGGPDGGDGGDGGNVYVTGTSDLTVLTIFKSRPKVQAEHGDPGDRAKKTGKQGSDVTFKVPIGTTLTDTQTGEEIEIVNEEAVVMVAEGGTGGQGNFVFRSSTVTTPRFAEKGTPGRQREFHIVLKLIADIGLIGLPNAGKSTLLNALTGAHAKTGDYNFTTLEPNLGVLEDKILADIPGLIEGAHEGKGLGIKFLKHIEKVSMLVHCISVESEDPWKDYQTIRNELRSFNKELVKKKELILLTKSDLADEKDLQEKLSVFKKKRKKALTISILEDKRVHELEKALQKT